MENATKALVIAGSVLIAILLIAFGMRIFNSASGASKSSQSTMDATAITTFNSQFSPYNGKTLSVSKVNNLVQKVIASNATNKSHTVTINDNLATSFTPVAGTVAIVYDPNGSGYITNININ